MKRLKKLIEENEEAAEKVRTTRTSESSNGARTPLQIQSAQSSAHITANDYLIFEKVESTLRSSGDALVSVDHLNIYRSVKARLSESVMSTPATAEMQTATSKSVAQKKKRKSRAVEGKKKRQKTNRKRKVAGDTLIIILKDQGGEKTFFRVNRSTEMYIVQNAYAKRKGVKASHLRLLYKGNRMQC